MRVQGLLCHIDNDIETEAAILNIWAQRCSQKVLATFDPTIRRLIGGRQTTRLTYNYKTYVIYVLTYVRQLHVIYNC